MKNFLIHYKETKKYDNGITRHVVVTVSKPRNDIGKDAKAATDVFINVVGNLKRHSIVSIQELNDKGMPVGEPILPTEGSAIVPTGR